MSGSSLFNTIFATFALLIIADLDDKVLALIEPAIMSENRDHELDERRPNLRSDRVTRARLEDALKVLSWLRRVTVIKSVNSADDSWWSEQGPLVALVVFLASMCLGLILVFATTALLCAFNGLQASYYTMQALAFGTNYQQ